MIWDSEADDGLLGSLFSNELLFSDSQINNYLENNPFQENSIFATRLTGDFFEGNVDFKKVLQKIGAVISDYDNEEIQTGNQLKEVVIETEFIKKPFNYLEYSNSDSTVSNYWQHQKNNFSGQAILNKKIGYLDTEKIFLSRNGSGAQRYLLYIPYKNDSNVSLNNPNIDYLEKNAAIKLKYLGIDGLITIFSFFAQSKRKTYLEKIYKNIAGEIERSILNDPFALSIISEFPLDLLKYFKSATVETILFTILKDIVNNDKEKVLLKLLKVLYLNNDFNPDLFLNKLLTIKIGKQSAFVTLYEKMNDWGGENNFSKVIIELTKIWLLSSYSDSNNKIYAKYAPAPNLIYDQKTILGFRKDDFSFTFEENNDIMIDESQFWGLGIPNLSTYNRYHPLQPMTVMDLNEKNNEDLVLEEDVPIPLFYLKAFDDKAAWENFEKTTWLILDIVSTFTGVGNLTKLKYLVKGSKLFYLKTVFGIIQVLSSVASIGLALIENSKNKELVNKIRSYLFWVEICTLGADVLSTKILTQKAGEARTVLAEYRKTVKNKKKLEEIDAFDAHLAEIDNLGKVSERGRRLGQKLSKSAINDLVGYLKKQGCDFEIFPINGSHEIKGFIGSDGKSLIFESGKQAAFVYTRTNMKFVVREGATVYETLHEFIHFKHAKSIGLPTYHSLGGANSAGELLKEQRVFDKMIEYKELLTRGELKHAVNYINEWIYNPRGIEPIEFSFDINKIPEVRKEIDIKNIFNLK